MRKWHFDANQKIMKSYAFDHVAYLSGYYMEGDILSAWTAVQFNNQLN